MDLPRVPSELIRQALADLRAVEEDPDYIVDFDFSHKPTGDGCHVDLAGAAMAKTLGAAKAHHLSPSDFTPPVDGQLLALEAFASGRLLRGLNMMHEITEGITNARLNSMYEYFDSSEWSDILDDTSQRSYCRKAEALATLLETHGL